MRACFGALTHELKADDEGFFRETIPLSTPAPPDAGYWHAVNLELLEPVVVDGPQPTALAQVMISPADSQFGVISDLDDTAIQTGATSLLRMMHATLLHNARTRVPFEGVAAFYAALQQGATGTGFHPIFYVSSSPWNLYDVIDQFLALQRIPMGPIMLRDWGISTGRLPFGHATHKLARIREILATYPAMRFILIGDSGQEDPEIYRDVAREHPGRILAAYIRDVLPGPARTATLEVVAGEIREAGSRMIVAVDTIAAAQHAAASGWISEGSLARVVAEVRSPKSRPG